MNYVIKQRNHAGQSVDAGARRWGGQGDPSQLRPAESSDNPHIRQASALLDASPDAAAVLHNVGNEYHVVNERGWTIRTVTE